MIKEGSKVSIHYTLKVEGEVVDSSEGQDPLSYVHGSKQIIPGLEAAMTGLKSGDKKDVSIEAELAYGPYNKEAIRQVPRSAFQEADSLKKGDVVSGQIEGQDFRATVQDIDAENVTVDLNHPLAGKTLEFQVEVVSVE